MHFLEEKVKLVSLLVDHLQNPYINNKKTNLTDKLTIVCIQIQRNSRFSFQCSTTNRVFNLFIYDMIGAIRVCNLYHEFYRLINNLFHNIVTRQQTQYLFSRSNSKLVPRSYLSWAPMNINIHHT